MAALVKIINEKVQRFTPLVKVINEVIQRTSTFDPVQVINEGTSVGEGEFTLSVTYIPVVKVLNEEAQTSETIIRVLQTKLVKVISETTNVIESNEVYETTPVRQIFPGPVVRGRKSFRRWYECYICGFSYPENELYSQRGQLVCKDDLDDKSHRDYMREGEPLGEEPHEPPWPLDGDES